MSPGFMDNLTMTPIEQIAEKGMSCVKMAIESSGISKKDLVKWSKFWKHFNKFQCVIESFVTIWSTHSNKKKENDVRSRVNNGLEMKVIHK